jgi:hypothetical protein
MTDKKRRAFLTQTSAVVASGILSACGGGAGGSPAIAGSVTTTPPALDPPVVPQAPVIPTPDPVDPGGTAIVGAQFTLSAVAAQSLAPYCLGFAFKRGDVPAGRALVADKGKFQFTSKNAWPDGSLKFAVLAGQVDLPAGTPVTVSLRSLASGAQDLPLGTERLRLSGAVAEIGCGAFGSVRWQGNDWDIPFKTWISGPTMSSWIYRKQVGSDPHLVGWLEVRAWAGGAVEILPWIENGYLLVAAPTNKAATYTFTLGGSQRMAAAIDLKHHQRTPLIDGTALSYWVGADPQVTPRHASIYLQSTELVPSYQAQVAATAPVIASLTASYKPLQAGNFNYDSDNMAAAGYQDPIGLLPQHDVLYLVSDAPAAYAAVIRNGFSAGRWAIHYRDETTQRPLRFSKYPNLNIGNSQGFKDTGGSTRGTYTPVPSGGNPPGWDVAHSPSVGYLAYLLSGRWYFMEEVQFATTANYLGNGDNNALRSGSKGLVQTAVGAWQTRSCAWDWRARVQALCVTPDDDAELRAEFIGSVEANIEHFHGRYVARANNPYGWIKPGEGYNGTLREAAPWQQDFVTAAFGFSLSLGLPISAAANDKLRSFFGWKAKSAVMRLGTRDGFWYVNAVPYTMIISPASSPDYDNGTGPWYATDKEVYDATYLVRPLWLGAIDNALAGEIMPGERALWGNLLPAIAYAVRHDVPGAAAAYQRLNGASNYKVLRDAFNLRPVWAVQPAGFSAPVLPVAPVVPEPVMGDPAWLAGKGIGEWFEIPGTAGAGGSAVNAYSGFAFNEASNEILIAAAGGHLDSADNRVVSLRITESAPVWRQLSAPSATVKLDSAYYPDGMPTSRHLYSSIHYVPQLNRVMLFGVRAAYGNAHSFSNVDGFDLAINTWDAAGSFADSPSGQLGALVIRSSGDVWTTGLARWSPATKAWTQPITKRTQDLIRSPIAHDSLRNQLFSLQWADGMGYSTQGVFATRVPLSGSEQLSVTFAAGPALDSFIAEKPSYAGMDYDAPNDRFLFYCGQDGAAGRVYVVKPNAGNVWEMSLLPLAGALRPPATPPAGVHNRFRYVPALRGFLLMATAKSNLYFIRTSA